MEVILTQQRRRGSTLNLTFFITRSTRCGKKQLTTEVINVHNSALVCFRFQENTNDDCLESYISVRKDESTKDSVVVNISYQTKKLHRFLCTDYWINYTKLEPNVKSIKTLLAESLVFYFVDVKIIVHNRTSDCLPVNSKLYEDTKLTDFHLTAKDGKVAVHKAVLGVNSEMFLTMLNGDWKETATGCISIDGVSVETLENLKKYMYLRTLPDDYLQLQQLLLVAACYLVDDLKSDCIVELVKLVTPANFDAFVEFACQNNVPELVKAIVKEMTDSMLDDQ